MLKAILAVIKDAYGGWNPTLWILMFAFPFVLPLGMDSFFSEDVPTDLPVGVVAEGGGELEQRIFRGIDADPTLRIEMHCRDMAECETAMRGSRIYGIVLLPADLERRALRSDPPTISVYTNAQSLLASNLVVNSMRNVIATQGAILEPRQLPAPIKTEIHIVGNPTSTFRLFLGIGLIDALFHVFAMMGGAYIFGYPIREKRVGKWLDAARHSPVIAVLGRAIPMIAVFWIEWIAMTTFALRSFPPMSAPDLCIYWLGGLAMITTCVAAGSAFVGFSWQLQFSLGSAAVAAGPAFAFCGATFPIFSMPIGMRIVAFILPLTHLVQLQSALLIGDIGRDRALHSLQILCGTAAFWSLFGIMLLAWRFKKFLRNREDEDA